MEKQKKNKRQHYRISDASACRSFVEVIEAAKAGRISEAEFMGTMMGVYGYIQNEEWQPQQGDRINADVMCERRADVDRSARRSQAARERMEKRKVEAGAGKKAQTAETSDRPGPSVMPPQAPASPHPKARRRPSVSDYDYDFEAHPILMKTPPEPQPKVRYRVCSGDEDDETYDPVGARRAYEIQCGRWMKRY